MSRLNLTLDHDTESRLEKHAAAEGTPRASLARCLIREALAHREAIARRRRLAADYAAGSVDARELLADFEAGELELWADEGA